MNRATELSTRYCNLINRYEEYIKKYTEEKEDDLSNFSPENRKLFEDVKSFFREKIERVYHPWRLIEGDKLEKITSIFFNRNEETMFYLKAIDYMIDELVTFSQEELTNYYKEQGKDINNELIKDEILFESLNLYEKENIDPKVYSEQTIEFHKIIKDFAKIQNELGKFYNDKDIINEINRKEKIDVKKIKDTYKSGMKLRLLEDMKEEKYHPIPAGKIGTVDYVDDVGTIHMKWEIGSSLGIIPEIDKFEEVEKIKVIMVEVGKEPYVKEIYNTLKDKQELVGGIIECVPTFFSKENSYDFITNEEGKIEGLPYNRFVYDKQDVIAGDFLVIKTDESTGEFITIDEEEEQFLIDKIKENCPCYNEIVILVRDIEEEEIEK